MTATQEFPSSEVWAILQKIGALKLEQRQEFIEQMMSSGIINLSRIKLAMQHNSEKEAKRQKESEERALASASWQEENRKRAAAKEFVESSPEGGF
jgi:hypothetical protein